MQCESYSMGNLCYLKITFRLVSKLHFSHSAQFASLVYSLNVCIQKPETFTFVITTFTNTKLEKVKVKHFGCVAINIQQSGQISLGTNNQKFRATTKMVSEERTFKEEEQEMVMELLGEKKVKLEKMGDDMPRKKMDNKHKPRLVNLASRRFNSQQEIIEQEEDEIKMCFVEEIVMDMYEEEEKEVKNEMVRMTKPRFVNLAARRFNSQEDEIEMCYKEEIFEEEVEQEGGLPKPRFINLADLSSEEGQTECPPLKKKARRCPKYPMFSVSKRKLNMEEELELELVKAGTGSDSKMLEEEEEELDQYVLQLQRVNLSVLEI